MKERWSFQGKVCFQTDMFPLQSFRGNSFCPASTPTIRHNPQSAQRLWSGLIPPQLTGPAQICRSGIRINKREIFLKRLRSRGKQAKTPLSHQLTLERSLRSKDQFGSFSLLRLALCTLRRHMKSPRRSCIDSRIGILSYSPCQTLRDPPSVCG